MSAAQKTAEIEAKAAEEGTEPDYGSITFDGVDYPIARKPNTILISELARTGHRRPGGLGVLAEFLETTLGADTYRRVQAAHLPLRRRRRRHPRRHRPDHGEDAGPPYRVIQALTTGPPSPSTSSRLTPSCSASPGRPGGPVSVLDLDARLYLAFIEGLVRRAPASRPDAGRPLRRVRTAPPPAAAEKRAERRAEIQRLSRLFGG